LRERVAIARGANADLFMSLHADTVTDPDIRGLSVYTLSQNASDNEAQTLADKENKADIVAGIDLSNESPEVTNILIDLVQRESMNHSADFAHQLIAEVAHDTHQLLQNTHRFAGFAVLKAPDIPSVLVETGYLSNERDEQMLRRPEYRAKLATALARAIEQYFAHPRKGHHA
jgi:N-acetylmuramoyl-L-alanine amidase